MTTKRRSARRHSKTKKSSSNKKTQRIKALKAMARRHPNEKHVGYFWKATRNGRPIRWTKQDLELFREFQAEARGK